MSGTYSADLRERELRACERGRLSRAKLAASFQVGETTVYRWLQTWRAEDGARPNHMPAGQPHGWTRRRWRSLRPSWPRPTI
jgi:transposase